MKNAHKKNVELFVFISTFEVFVYLCHPTTTYKPTHNSGSAVAKLWIAFFESDEVSKVPDKLLRFFLFYDVHIKLCSFYVA